ncbi:S16 family serine protease [Streptomyces lancefieldiae]|uniref:S16 family serine protease n=1 Tax=Streptomyces lancefieldiae TaxID=3075520 RepID=A0ABU3AT76_9ACTN|nr:S16 family serine protease [Streptomyces sp. DSM 40712]MDT0613040.1 S16 family serine protease [Streptomyces sp. DSM 40712]
MLSRLTRPQALAVCALPVVALLAAVLFAPLPFSVARPGLTADVLGSHRGAPVITIKGAPTHDTSGQLRMTAIEATGPEASIHLGDVIGNWFDTDRAVMPRDAVYPSGDDLKEIEEHNAEQMKESQDAAVTAALGYLDLEDSGVDVSLSLERVGGPSAGLLFSLGIIDKLGADDLTGGRVIAGTGTITSGGKVGAVGGVPLKTQSARRDGATVFLVPKAECSEAQAQLPKGLRLIPVTTLKGAVDSLRALDSGKGEVPAC